MSDVESDLAQLLRTLEPVLHDGVYAYCLVSADATFDFAHVMAAFREAEGITLITTEHEAQRHQWPVLFRAAWITLSVQSDLHAVGLTAAFSRTLGDAGISCNVVAAAHHDHLFVPVARAADALALLRELQQRAG